jgi:hypothetical protein
MPQARPSPVLRCAVQSEAGTTCTRRRYSDDGCHKPCGCPPISQDAHPLRAPQPQGRRGSAFRQQQKMSPQSLATHTASSRDVSAVLWRMAIEHRDKAAKLNGGKGPDIGEPPAHLTE